MAAAHLNGVELAYQQMGEGPDLVMVHGLAASRAFWFLQYAMPLSQHFRVTLFDLRGHGYSSRPESGYDAISLADDLGGLLDHLNIAHCALVGHSYGGGVALEFAGRQPARVDRLAIMDTKVNRVQPEQRLADSPYLSPFEKALAARSEYNWETEPQLGLLFLEVLARQRVASGNASRDTAVGDGENSARDAFTPFGEGRGALRTARQWVDLLDHTQARSEFLMAGMEGRGDRRIADADFSGLRWRIAVPAVLSRLAETITGHAGGDHR